MRKETDARREYNPRTIYIRVFVVVLIAAAFWAGLHVGYTKSREAETLAIFADTSDLPPRDVDFTLLFKAWNALEEKFVPPTTTDALTSEELVWGTVEGLTNAYNDPYTVFFPPEESEIFEEDISGSFGGVGIEIGVREDVLTVIAPLKGSPGELAGIESGDRIVEIDGESTEGISIDEAVRKIRGEPGTQVALTLAQEGEKELKTVEVTRQIIDIPTIDTELRSDGVFVIRLFNFSAPSANLFREALREFVESGSGKLILDLRDNPGGFLEAAVDMASWFLPAGKTVVTEDFGEKLEPRVHRSKGYNIFTDKLQMAVLVNRGSASASEILAGALKEHGVATLVGSRTFGKGSVQELVKLTPETSLKVTIARWLTPLGNSISDGGLVPDVEVELMEEDMLEGKDPQLESAVRLLLEV